MRRRIPKNCTNLNRQEKILELGSAHSSVGQKVERRLASRKSYPYTLRGRARALEISDCPPEPNLLVKRKSVLCMLERHLYA